MSTEVIRDKAEFLAVWEREAARFRQLYQSLPAEKLKQKVPTSNCGHTYGQHIPCMLVWMKWALEFFRARLNKKPQPFRDYEVSMLEFTNRELAHYEQVPYSEVWKRLDAVEAKFREVVGELDIEELFSDEGHAWDHLVWSTFGHYDEHSTELEWERSGRTDLAPDKEWLNPLQSR